MILPLANGERRLPVRLLLLGLRPGRGDGRVPQGVRRGSNHRHQQVAKHQYCHVWIISWIISDTLHIGCLVRSFVLPKIDHTSEFSWWILLINDPTLDHDIINHICYYHITDDHVSDMQCETTGMKMQLQKFEFSQSENSGTWECKDMTEDDFCPGAFTLDCNSDELGRLV